MRDGAVPAPLRILHVVEVFGSGVGIVAKTLAERQAAAGDAVAIAHGRCPETPEEVRDFVDRTVELHELPWERRTVAEQLRATRALRALVRSWRPDVVHLHSSFAGVVGALALGRATPTVYTPHGYSFTMLNRGRARRFAYRAVERITASRVDVVGAVSEAEATDARRVAPAGKVVVVRNGIPELDAGAMAASRPEVERPGVVTVGRVAEQHIPAQTAAILAAVSSHADVAWVGGNGRSPELDEVVRAQGVRVTGWVEREQVQSILRASTCCLHWTAWDGQPLSILEAMAAGAVVVARDIAATREILGPRQVCASEAEAVELLRKILTRPELRGELLREQNARRPAFGAERMARDWRRVYEGIVAAPAPLRSSAAAPSAARELRSGRRSRRYESSPEAAP